MRKSRCSAPFLPAKEMCNSYVKRIVSNIVLYTIAIAIPFTACAYEFEVEQNFNNGDRKAVIGVGVAAVRFYAQI